MNPDLLRRDLADGLILRLVREAGTLTRAGLGDATGWARSTVTRRVDALLEAGLLEIAGEAGSTGGRPPEQIHFNQRAGALVVADLGVSQSRLALVDLLGNPLDPPIDIELDLTSGPEHTLPTIRDAMEKLAKQAGESLLAIGIGVPAPIDTRTSLPTDPALLSAWNNYPIRKTVESALSIPVFLEKDANLMALAEQRRNWPQASSLLFVKVGTGVDSGLVIDGNLHRGANGAAGDIGHIQLEGYADRLCNCGRNGCLEAVAGGQALAAQISALGRRAPNARAIVSLVQSGDSEAKSLLRQAGTNIGVVLAGAVSAIDPQVIVLGGDLGVEPLLVASVRAEIQRRSLTLASRHLVVEPSRLTSTAGIIGAAEHVADRLWPALQPRIKRRR